MVKKIVALIFLGAFLISCSTGIGTNDAIDEGPPQDRKPIVLGDISDDPAEVIEGTQPLADYLAAQLSEFGITEGQVRVVSTADEMTRLLQDGEVDLYFDSVYPATLISDAIGATPFLRRWRFGVEEYQSVIFASLNSGITSLDDLKGNVIAFDNPFSTSGYVLPAVKLIESGYTLVGRQSPISSDEIGFVFSYDDENTLQWVISGKTAAGATDDYNFDVAFPPGIKANLVELARTDFVPRQVVIARPSMDAALLEAISAVLISADESDEGAAALDAFQTSQFDEFPQGIRAALEDMRGMMDLVAGIQNP